MCLDDRTNVRDHQIFLTSPLLIGKFPTSSRILPHIRRRWRQDCGKLGNILFHRHLPREDHRGKLRSFEGFTVHTPQAARPSSHSTWPLVRRSASLSQKIWQASVGLIYCMFKFHDTCSKLDLKTSGKIPCSKDKLYRLYATATSWFWMEGMWE
jgi:hypothetical protein